MVQPAGTAAHVVWVGVPAGVSRRVLASGRALFGDWAVRRRFGRVPVPSVPPPPPLVFRWYPGDGSVVSLSVRPACRYAVKSLIRVRIVCAVGVVVGLVVVTVESHSCERSVSHLTCVMSKHTYVYVCPFVRTVPALFGCPRQRPSPYAFQDSCRC